MPYGVREVVEKELDRLVENGILIPVKHSKVATPIVVVIKSNGTIRICVDCKRTLNRLRVNTICYRLSMISLLIYLTLFVCWI